MVRTIRASRRNPIDPSAAQEMYDFISSEGGRLLVEWETEGGRKARAIAHLASGPADVEGRKVITIDRVVRPDGVPVAAWEGKSFSIPLEKIRTLGYVADDEETEAITAAKFQFRFLSPTFRSAFKYNEKEYPSLEAALIDAATNPEAIKKGYVEEGVIPGPAFLRAGWFTPGVKPPQPSDETLNTVLNIVNARFADPVVRRMLVSTGDRRFELPADEGGSFLGVDLNDIYTRVRRVAVDSGVQPTGKLRSRYEVPTAPAEAKFGSPEAKEFLKESREAYEELEKRFSRQLESQSEAPFGFVDVDSRYIYTNEEQPYQALIYISTINRDRVADTLETRDIQGRLPFGLKIISQPTNPLNTAGIAADLTAWILQHPEWEAIGIATGVPQPTTRVFVSGLKARMTSPGMIDIARAQAEGSARDTNGDLLLPVGGVLVGPPERRASEYVLTFERPADRVALFDKNALVLLGAAAISGVKNREAVKLFTPISAHARTLLRITGLAPVVPIRPDVEVPETPVRPPPEGGPPAGETEAESLEKTLNPLPGQEAIPAAEEVTPPSSEIVIPSEALTERMKSSPYLYIADRLKKAMEEIRDNADFILSVGVWGLKADAFLKRDDVDLLERAKVYVESLRKANTVLQGTVDKLSALRKLLIQMRKILSDLNSSDPAVRRAIGGLQMLIGEREVDAEGRQLRAEGLSGLIEASDVKEQLALIRETYQKRLNDDLRSRSDVQMLRGLTLFAPAKTSGGHYDLSGEDGTLVLREQLYVPLSTPPINFEIGREYQIGDVIELSNREKVARRRTATEASATGILILFQNRPVNVAPIRMQYFAFPQGRIADINLIAERYNQDLLPIFRKTLAETFKIQFELGDAGKKKLLEEISEFLTEKDPKGENYIKVAEARRDAERKALAAKMLEGREEVSAEEADKILKEINEATKFAGANIVNDPVLYALLVDTKLGRVYYPEEVNLEQYARGMKFFDESTEEGQKQLKRLEMSPKFMSKFPLDPGSIDFLRTATAPERDAVINVLMPSAKDGNLVKFPLPWRPSRFRKSKQFKSDVKDLREAVDAVRHYTARVAEKGSGSSGRSGFGTVSVRRGAAVAGSALPGTLGKGTVKGRGTLEAGSQFRVDMHRAKPGAEVGDFYIKGDLSRLRRYLQELSQSSGRMKGLAAVNGRELELRRARILEDYRVTIGDRRKTITEAEADFRASVEEMQALKEQLDNMDEATRNRLEEEGGEFVDDSGATQYLSAQDVRAALRAVENLEDLNAISAEITRRGDQALEAAWRRKEAAAPLIDKFFIKFRRPPTQEEIILLEGLALQGDDPFEDEETPTKANSMRRRTVRNPFRRNAGTDDFFDIGLDELEAAAAAGPTPTRKAETPPPAGGAPPREPPPPPPPEREEEPEEGRFRATGGRASQEAQARAASASQRRQKGVAGALSPLARTIDITQTRVEDLRNTTQQAWAAFNSALNDNKRTKIELNSLLSQYLTAAADLQSALDERDRQYLVKHGADQLRELLRSEALTSLSAAQVSYSRAPRGVDEGPGAKKPSVRARLTAARKAADQIDPYGRPLVPPSPEKLEQRGLSPVDLATARAREVQDGFLNLPTPINYAQLVEAAKIAAEAHRRKEHGISVGAVSCRVMGDEGGIRNRLDRELIARMFDIKTYRGGPRAGAPQPNAALVNWDKIMIVWLSPDSDHAIVFVNKIGVCEFHSTDYPVLIASILRYISDWFSDPRHSVERADYSVFVGRSGFDRLYQIWGRWPVVEGRAATAADTSRPSPRALFDRMAALGIYDLSKEKEFTPLGKVDLPVWLRGMTFFWVTDTTAMRMGFENLREYLTAEAETYREALAASSYAKPASESYELLRRGEVGERAAHAAAVSLDVQAAMEGTRKAVTLFYPELYNASGENLSANSNTPLDMAKHLQAVAAAVPDGGLVRIVDLSLFRGETRFSIMQAPKVRAVASARGALKGIVPTPYRALAEMMRNKVDAEIEVVIPQDNDIKSDLPTFFPEYEDLPAIRPIFLPSGYGISALAEKNAIAPGSTLVLWNDPDVPGDDRAFGRVGGSRIMADVVAQQIGFIKRIYVETGNTQVEAKLSKDAASDREKLEAALSRMDEVTAMLIRAVYFQKRTPMQLAQELREQKFEAVLPDGRVVEVRKENIEEVIEAGLEEMRRLMTEDEAGDRPMVEEVPLVNLTEFRQFIVESLATVIKAAGTSREVRIAALGVSKEVRLNLEKRVGFANPTEAAQELLNEIARAYKGDPALYISQGTRGKGSILLNRGLRSNVSRRTKVYGTKGRY